MKRVRPRVLVLAPEKDLADVICHGLRAIVELHPELDVTLDSATARRQLADVRYDLLVLGRDEDDDPLNCSFTGLDAETVRGVPVILVGGRPNGHPGNLARVPLPLSFNLLRDSVLTSLAGKLPRMIEHPSHEERTPAQGS